jgi:hypothetical protein
MRLQCGFSIAGHNNDSKSGMFGRDDITRDFCTANDVWYQAYSPLGGITNVDVLGRMILLTAFICLLVRAASALRSSR